MPNSAVRIDLSHMSDKQKAFFLARERYVAYGGARAGGKSWALRHKAILLALNYPGIKMLLLRRTYKDLERNHVREIAPILDGFASYSRQDKLFRFPGGSMLEMGYCDAESDVLQYQGQEYDVIFIDEATQFTEYQFSTLTACVRGANDFPKRMYLTCNPGGVGHEWVKRLFVSKRYKENENPSDYRFIAATVYDNRVFLQKDPEYVNALNALPNGLREAWRDGNWDMLAGRYFTEFDRSIHVIDPFKIPSHWRRYRAIDYGLDCLACVWIAVDEEGRYYLYREYAKSDMTIGQGAAEIVDLSKGEKIEYTVAPTDIWARSQESGKTKADLFREGGILLPRGNNDREAGWLAVKELLRQRDGDSRLKIFSSCREIIECIPALQIDMQKPTDCSTEPHDITHLPDALRYFALCYVTPSPGKTDPLSPIAKHEKRLIAANKKSKRR